MIGGGTEVSSSIPTNATDFVAMFGGGASANEFVVTSPMPKAGTVSSFFVETSSLSTGESVTFTVRKNGGNTLVTCTVPDVAIQCSDPVHLWRSRPVTS